MPPFARFLTAAVVVSVQSVWGQTLWADVTPEQVWQGWQDASKAQGQTVTTASEKREGDTLTVTGITMTTDSDGGKGSVTLGKVQFQDKGDGTVAIILPESYPVQMTLPPPKDKPDEKPTDLTLTILMPGADIVASGVPLSISYQTTLPRLEIAAEVRSGDTTTKSGATILAKLTDVSAHYLIEGAEAGQNMVEDFSAKTVSLTAKVTADTADSGADVTLSLSDIGGKAELTGVPTSGMDDFNAALQQGLALNFSTHYGAGALNVAGTDGTKPITFAGTLGSGGFAMTLDAAALHMDGSNTALALTVTGTDPATETAFTFAGSLADFASKLVISGADLTDTADFPAALKAGLKMSGNAGVGATSVDFASATQPPTKLKASLASASTDFAIDAGRIAYNLGTKAVSVTLSAPEIPVPEANASLGELAVAIDIPVAKSDTSAPFTYVTKIIDLNPSETLWALADPTKALSHQPISLILDTKGQATITRDMMQDAAALESGSDQSPGQLNALDLTNLNLKAGGAEVAAQGAFTFDNSDLTTFSGMPAPTGKVDIKAVGVNALIDTLVKMGLVPQDQALQGRMMLSMFANTSATADEMTSTLEFKDKHFFANGQQLQ